MATVRRPTTGSMIWRLALRWQAEVDRVVAPLEITHAQYTVLASLRGMTMGGDRPSQRQLAGHIGLDPIFISKLIKALEAAGLVARTPDPNDARAVRLALTAHGIALTDEAVLLVRDLQRAQTASLGAQHGERRRAFDAALAALLGD